MAKATTTGMNWMQKLIVELKRDKGRMSILAVLAVVALLVVGRLVLKSRSPSKAAAASTVPVTPSSPDANAGAGTRKAPPIRPTDQTIGRDIFHPNLEYFPLAAPRETPPQPPKVTSPKIDEAARAKAIEIEAKKSLTLQSTILGSRPTAILNGKFLQVGDVCGGFKIVAIGASSCDVEKDGVRVTISMKQ